MAVENTQVTTPITTETTITTPVTSTPSPISLKDDDLVELEVGGQKVQKKWSEARNGFMMQEDYTRKTQGLSTQAKELKELYEGLTAKQKELLEKEAGIDAILGRAPRSTKPQVADDDVITNAQAKQMVADALAQHSETLTKNLTSQFQKESGEAEQARQFQRWEDMTTDVSDRLLKENPVLKTIPQLSLVLKREAMADNPKSEREMVSALVKAGQRIAKSLDDEVTERIKARAVKKEELAKKAPERAGGHTNFAAPKKDYMKGRNRINFDAIESDVLAALDALEE